ncbi:MAG: hypothetical protein JOZ24_00055 [Candidatus Eremiobacteraeota bacterium]|nr:hypothetical protein [Candidatus Eremiobacteraeota bacterium]
MIDVTSAAARRRFYLDRARRKNTRGGGSNLARLMDSDLPGLPSLDERLLTAVDGVLAGALAAAAYAPARMTSDVDVLVRTSAYGDAERCLRHAGYRRERTLAFPNAALGLFGSSWRKGSASLDLISSPQPWVAESFQTLVRNKRGLRILPLPYLVLMKLDSARGIDQGDLGRMLGRLRDDDVEQIVSAVCRHYGDPHAADDIRQYAAIGRWEYETDGAERDGAGRDALP